MARSGPNYYNMKFYQIAIASIVGGLALYAETRQIKTLSLFFEWINSIPLIGLSATSLIFFILNTRKFIRHKKLIVFAPVLICLIFLSMLIGQIKRRAFLDNSETSFIATTYQIGNDGGFKLDFKKNGHLKAEKDDHWRVTYYWGRYEMEKDSILMHIPLDFKLDKKAILTDTSLRFSDDTISFQVIRPND